MSGRTALPLAKRIPDAGPSRTATVGAAVKTLMMVSADAGPQLRTEVLEGRRPCPEFLRLEQVYGVELLDWRRVGLPGSGRSVRKSLGHVSKAVSMLDRFDVIFTDGEHLGIPLALAMYARGRSKPHLMIAHNPSSRAKQSLLRLPPVQSRISRIVLHSQRQFERLPAALRMPPAKFRLTPYGADTEFWRPQVTREQALLVVPGRERRDFLTLAKACSGIPEIVFVTGASLHSPRAAITQPASWPPNFRSGFVDYLSLRRMYAEAKAIVVPLLASDSPAGITAVLEAMAAGKTVIASDTDGLRGVIEDGVTGLLVAPGDAAALRDAIVRVLQTPRERARLGANARTVAEQRYGLDVYCDALAAHFGELAGESTVGASLS